MELVIRVDLDKAQQSLPELFRLIGDCRPGNEGTGGTAGVIKNDLSHVIGEWDIEETDQAPNPLETSYRRAAVARYARPEQIEVDRFATVSLTDDGAFVQGWLHVPQADVAGLDPSVSRKPPVSVMPVRNITRNAG